MTELLTNLDTTAGLAVLALIAFCDTLIGIGFFVFGEVAFLAAGAAYASNGAILPAIVVMVFAWAGDVASHMIGATYGPRLSTRYMKYQKRRRAWRWAKRALETRGASFVVLARLLGPVAWVTPFLAGALGMPKRRFLPAAALGVVLGVGQFIVYGALGVQILGVLLPFVADHLGVITLAVCIVVAVIFVWRRCSRSLVTKTTSAIVMAGGIFLGSNFLYFFVFNSHSHASAPREPIVSVCDVASGPFVVHPGQTSLHLPQPVNVILFTDQGASDLMSGLGWYRNMTFTHDEISFSRYVRSVIRNKPPISELYLNGVPADSAHQLPGTLKEREHIRWWRMGSGVYFGAISKTDEIAVKYYSHLPVLLHDIDPQVDASRDLFASQIEHKPNMTVLGYAHLTDPVPDGVFSDYQTDGRILVIGPENMSVGEDIKTCLNLE